jgi:hypothetical protein
MGDTGFRKPFEVVVSKDEKVVRLNISSNVSVEVLVLADGRVMIEMEEDGNGE